MFHHWSSSHQQESSELHAESKVGVFCLVMLCFVLEKFRLVESGVPEGHK